MLEFGLISVDLSSISSKINSSQSELNFHYTRQTRIPRVKQTKLDMGNTYCCVKESEIAPVPKHQPERRKKTDLKAEGGKTKTETLH